jgi:hypothetical protein
MVSIGPISEGTESLRSRKEFGKLTEWRTSPDRAELISIMLIDDPLEGQLIWRSMVPGDQRTPVMRYVEGVGSG